MSNYLANINAIFTSYGLSKIDDIILGADIPNFTKLIIGDVPIELNENITLENFPYTYAFPVLEVKNNGMQKTVTISAEIPNETGKINIESIGLICTENNKDYLFAYAKQTLYKPSKLEISYALDITLDFNLSIINFNSDNLNFNASGIFYSSVADFINARAAFNTAIIALEKSHIKNAITTGYNRPQVQYVENNKLYNNVIDLHNILETSLTYDIINASGTETHITDIYYNRKDYDFNSYKIMNLSNFSSQITSNNLIKLIDGSYSKTNYTVNGYDFNQTAYIQFFNGLLKSEKSTVTPINRTILIQLQLGNPTIPLGTDGVIIQQIGESKIIIGEEDYADTFIIQRYKGLLTLDISYNSGRAYCEINLTPNQWADLVDGLHNLVFYCDISDIENPILNVYLDGIKLNTTNVLTEGIFNKSNTLGSVLLNYSLYVTPYTNNGNYINKIACFDRILTDEEIYQISILPK